VRPLLFISAAIVLGGCRFWYKPVPVANAIGEEKALLAGDSVHVHRETRFEIYGPNPEAVYDGYEQLNRAYRAFERHIAAPAPRLAVVLVRDSLVPLDAASERAIRDRGFTPLLYARPRSVRSRRRYSGLDYGGVNWPIAPTAARALLARYANDRLGGATQPDSALLERFPLWYRAAILHLVGEAGAMDRDMELVREKRDRWLPLRDLMVMVRSTMADTLLDPSRRGDSDETTQLVAAQASTLGRYLVEREGPAVLGQIARGYLAGSSPADILGSFRKAPRTLVDLERSWRVWVELRQD
jgi:hypothetical protein